MTNLPSKTFDIQFPVAGVVRRLGLNADADGRAVWATNVRLEDSLTHRLRGGSFTGIAAGTKASPVYRDRALTTSGRAIMASRQGAHANFSFSADISDTMRATVFQLAEAGEQGDPVVALVPHKDACLLCFTAGETWVLSGDPTTGAMRNVSREVGIIADGAWCKNHDTVYFLSSRGLYSVGADGSGLKAVSEDRIPEELIAVDDDGCVLDYRHADRGVYISLSEGVSWFYDTARDGFWPFKLDTEDSHVLIGPFQLGQHWPGRVVSLQGKIASDSDDVAWRIVTGDTAEEAAANGKAAIVAALAGDDYSDYVSHETGTLSDGAYYMAYPRTSAVWFCLWLHSEGDWAYEAIRMTGMLSLG